MQFSFYHSGYATTGSNLVGQCKFEANVLVYKFSIQVQTPPLTTTTLHINVDGSAQSTLLVIPPKAKRIDKSVQISVNAGSVLTLSVASSPSTPANCCIGLAVTVSYQALSYAQAHIPTNDLKIQYTNSSENVTLYNYSTTTHQYSPVSTSLLTNRATISPLGKLITIDSATAMNVLDSGVNVTSWYSHPSVNLGSGKKLTFLVNNKPVGELTTSGLKVTYIESDTTPAYATYKFSFHDANGVLQATLDQYGKFEIKDNAYALN